MAPLGLLVWGRPPTANKPLSPSGRRFLGRVRAAHAMAGSQMWSGLLYGCIYWFVRDYDPRRHPDADNISKKIWDEFCLQGIAYSDDSQVRLRTAAVIMVGTDFGGLQVSDFPDIVVEALGRLIDPNPDPAGMDASADGFTYIEYGPWQQDMLRLGASGLPQPGTVS